MHMFHKTAAVHTGASLLSTQGLECLAMGWVNPNISTQWKMHLMTFSVDRMPWNTGS